jgi:ubiquinone/menaquinone biosynthesis C-methylase UbiE
MKLLLLLVLAMGCAQNKNHHHSSAANAHAKHMNDKFTRPDIEVDKWVERFENRSRDVFIHRSEIVNSLNIKAGMSVADVGAGTGAFIGLFNSKVGKTGRVYAVDISSGFVEFMNERARIEKWHQVSAVLGEMEKTTLAANSVDLIFVCDTYHHFENPEAMLKDFKNVLKEKGELAIVDFDRIEGKSRPWVLEHISKSKQEYINEIESHGFKLLKEEKTQMKENFVLRFVKN